MTTTELTEKLSQLDGPEWNSSDEEETIPIVETETTTSSKKKKKKKKKSNKKESNATASSTTTTTTNSTEAKDDTSSNVLYFGHLPRTFQEEELYGFLSQFGKVEKVRLARSKKTANPKGYAFCQMEDSETAAIIADTMNGYLLDSKKMVCHIIPSDNIHPRMFVGAHSKFLKKDWVGMHRHQVNNTTKSKQAKKKLRTRLLEREHIKRNKMKQLGIDYDFPGYKAALKQLDDDDDDDVIPQKDVPNKHVAESEKKKKKKERRKTQDEEQQQQSNTPSSSEKKKRVKAPETNLQKKG